MIFRFGCIFAFLVLTSGILGVKAQTSLTNKAVFDFQVNDVFHFEEIHSRTALTYNLKVKVLEKEIIPSDSSVIYKVKRTKVDSSFYRSNGDSIVLSKSVKTLKKTYPYNDSPVVNFDSLRNIERLKSLDTSEDTIYFGESAIGYQADLWVGSNYFKTHINKWAENLGLVYQSLEGSGARSTTKGKRLVYYNPANGSAMGKPLNFNLNSNQTKTLPDHKSEIFQVFPNPASDYFRMIFTTNTSDDKHLTLLNMGGEKVLSKKSCAKHFRINTTSLADGIYYLRVRYNGNIYEQKLSIKH